jgi:transcriptional regulator with XRE-family HTH domain
MQHLGEMIRQVRRLRNLTQQELAGERFSKSYVSAIEHNRTAPSTEALRYFAQQLGQADGDFAALLQQPDVAEALAALKAAPVAATNGLLKRDEALSLLHTLLEQTGVNGNSPHRQLPMLSPEALLSLPPHLGAKYYILLGRSLRERGVLIEALEAFESALTLSPPQQQMVILDEIGQYHFLQGDYATALGYHLHARHLLLKIPGLHAPASLRLTVELHCGDAYQALGAYQQAFECYEFARAHLSAHHDVATAAQVHVGLGTLIYAALFPNIAPFPSSAPAFHLPTERIEREWQRARSFFLQGISFYQVGGDRERETGARLKLAALLLDWSEWLRRTIQAASGKRAIEPSSFAPCISLLKDAEEQCRQALFERQPAGDLHEVPSPDLSPMLYTALAYLIRIAIRRALLARLEEGHIDRAYRARAFAAFLCQQVLDTLADASPPWDIIQQTLTTSAEELEYRPPVLPHLGSALAEAGDVPPQDALTLVELLVAAGEVAEELGRAAPTSSYAHVCYVQADHFFRSALSLVHQLNGERARDPGSLTRLYARYISLLKERASASPELANESSRKLAEALEQSFWRLCPESKPWLEGGHEAPPTVAG